MLSACEQRFEHVYFNTRPNKGLCATLNEALALCKGKYVSLIASDDIMLMHKTQLQVHYLEQHPEVTGVFAGIELIDSNNLVIDQRVSTHTEYSFQEIFSNKHDLPALTQMYRLKDINEVGGYDENIKIEDWFLLLKLTNQNKILRYIPEVLCQYRVHDENFSKNNMNMIVEMKRVANCFKTHANYYQINYKLNSRLAKEFYRQGLIKKSILTRLKSSFDYFRYKFFNRAKK
jgi:glycosyltransferase involved in cell wall biosynthesis